MAWLQGEFLRKVEAKWLQPFLSYSDVNKQFVLLSEVLCLVNSDLCVPEQEKFLNGMVQMQAFPSSSFAGRTISAPCLSFSGVRLGLQVFLGQVSGAEWSGAACRWCQAAHRD